MPGMPMSSSDDVGAERRRAPRARPRPAVHDADRRAELLRAAHASDLGRVVVVVDDEHAPRRGSRARRGRGPTPSGRVRLASGSRTMNSLPLPGPSLCASTVAAVQLDEAPHQRAGRCRARPASRRLRPSTCVNMSNTAAACSAAMPMPLSRTDTIASSAARGPPSAGCGRRGSVYLAALVSRFAKTCVRRTESPRTVQRFVRQVTVERVAAPTAMRRPARLDAPAARRRRVERLAAHARSARA